MTYSLRLSLLRYQAIRAHPIVLGPNGDLTRLLCFLYALIRLLSKLRAHEQAREGVISRALQPAAGLRFNHTHVNCWREPVHPPYRLSPNHTIAHETLPNGTYIISLQEN
jgi:hypothetical protein